MKKVIICLAALMVLSAPAMAQVILSTGFEASQGYTLGNIGTPGQNGWTNAWTTNSDPALTQVINTASYGLPTDQGTQCLAVVAGTVSGTSVNGCTWAEATSTAYSNVVVSVDLLHPSAAVDNGNFFFDAKDGITGANQAAFGLFGNGNIYFDTRSGWVNTGVAYAANTWYNFTANINAAAGTYSLWVNGILVGNGFSTPAVGTNVGQAYIYHVGGAPGENIAAMDNLTYTAVPEPSSLVALFAGLFGVAGYVRRRK